MFLLMRDKSCVKGGGDQSRVDVAEGGMTQEGVGVIEGEGFEGLAGLEFAISQVFQLLFTGLDVGGGGLRAGALKLRVGRMRQRRPILFRL